MPDSTNANHHQPSEPSAETQRISEVMQQAGLSKELIHHYLRQGLVPRSDARARYTDQQVRLLRQIRVLREDHNLPLKIIRRIFTIFDFAPERIEPLVLTESLCKRVTRLADGDLTLQTTYDEAELARAAGISSDQLAEYARAGIITPLSANGGARYSAYDAHVLALCQCGLDLGIPFE
jgi:DNA-binding transcriptional MerR regulator